MLGASVAHAEPVAITVVNPVDYATKVLAPHKGRVVVVNFWATWCAPCLEELPGIVQATARAKADLALVAVDGASDLAAIRKVLAKQRGAFTAYVIAPGDPEPFINLVDKAWDGTVPRTIIYGGDGAPRVTIPGPVTPRALSDKIAKAR